MSDSSNPYLSPESESSPVTGMTLGEKLYTAVVVLCAGFLFVGALMWHFVILPGIDDAGILYVVISIIWLECLTLAVTAGLNIAQGKLLVIPTVIQAVCLCVAVYFFPFGLLGFLLLYRRVKRDDVAQA